MQRSPVVICALAALLVLPRSSATAASQVPGAADSFQGKQEFVAALRQLSITLTGRFGDEGRRLRADIDALALALKRWDESISAAEAALRQRGKDADALLALGATYLDRYRVDEALQALEAASKIGPPRADVYWLIAMAHGLASRPLDAFHAWRRAAELEPDDVTARYEMARYAMETNTAGASAPVFAAFQNAAGQRMAQRADGLSFSRPGLLRQTAGVAPIFPPAPYVRAFELLMKGRFDEAIAECRKAVESDPLLETSGDRDPLFAGAAALRRGDLAAALLQFDHAIKATPDRAEAHRALGVASRLDEQLEQSVEAYRNAVRLKPMDERARLGLADVLVDLARFEEAEQLLDETVRRIPDSVQAHYRLGRLYQSQGDYAAALKELEYVAQFTPLVGQDPLHEIIALIYASQADFAGVIPALRKQLAVNPNNADAHRRLGDAYARQERPMEALAEFTAAVMIDPLNVLGHTGVSQIHFREGRYDAAARAARAAVRLNAAHSEARYVLAMSLIRLGQTDEGNRELQEFQRLQTEAALAAQRKYEIDGLNRQIAVATRSGDLQAAIPLLRHAIELEPDVASHYADLGIALVKTNQTTEAIAAFENAVARQPADLNVHRQLAEAYLAAGRVDASRKQAALYREMIDVAKKQRALRFANP